jgi:hypothetical protein
VVFVPARKTPEWPFVSERSALVAIGAGPSAAVLFAGVGSGVVEVTIAEFVAVPVTFDAMATTMSTLVAAPLAMAPPLQITVVVPLHDHPAVGVETNVKLLGSVSVTVTSAAPDGPRLFTVRVYVAFVPAVKVPTCDLAKARFALVKIVIGPSDPALFTAVGSGVVDVTVAVFVTLPVSDDATATSRSTLVVAPLAIVACVHVTVVLPEHDHPTVGDDTNVMPTGSASVTVAFAASEGPLFLTATVNVAFEPAVNDPVCDFVTARSALVPTVTGPSAAALLPGVGSGVVDDTTTLFVTVPVTFAATATMMSTVEVAPLEIGPRTHETNVVPEQDHPTVGDDTNVRPTGSVSRTVALAASDGPLFLTDTL